MLQSEYFNKHLISKLKMHSVSKEISGLTHLLSKQEASTAAFSQLLALHASTGLEPEPSQN